MSAIDLPNADSASQGKLSFGTEQRLTFAEMTVIALTVTCALLQLGLQFVQQINWDEFFYLSQVYEYQRGTLSKPLQTIHVHLFGWLPNTYANEVYEIRTGRVVMWLLELATLCLFYWIALRFFSRFASLLAVLAYISAGFVLLHGTSFRTDPIAIFLIMVALALLIRGRLQALELLVVSLALATALLVTVKVVFFAAALAAAGLWRVAESPQPLKLLVRLSVTALSALLFFFLMYKFHSWAIGGAAASAATSTMLSAYHSTLLSGGLFPTGTFVLNGIIKAPIQTFLFFCGFVSLCVALFRADGNRRDLVLILMLASPLASLVVYRNAYPYFFAFIFPSAMVLVAYAVDKIKFTPLLKMTLAVLMVVTFLHTLLQRLPFDQNHQLRVLNLVHQMFPEGTAYIDRNSMVPGFSKHGFFMSNWGMRSYRQNGRPLFADLLREEVIPLLIVNGPALRMAMNTADTGDRAGAVSLLPGDVDTLQQNYIRHWGPVWIAGRSLKVSNEEQIFSIQVPGIYTIETNAPVAINNQALELGETIFLARGKHSVRAEHPIDLVLRWGKRIYRPGEEASDDRLYPVF